MFWQPQQFPDFVPTAVRLDYIGGRVLNAEPHSSQQPSRQVWDRVAQRVVLDFVNRPGCECTHHLTSRTRTHANANHHTPPT
jgi:hypothetical protein